MPALDAAAGRWPALLMDLGGLSAEQLTDRHQPCPACGGTDRYRWDRDDGPGGWFCNQCGGKDGRGGAGSGIDLLMRVRQWDLKQALSAVEQHLGVPGSEPARRTKPGRPHRAPDKPPPDAPPPRLGNATAQWCYRDAAGEQLFWIQRFDLAHGRKLFIHRVWLDGQWHYPRSRGVDADPWTCEWPSPRPLYRLPDLITRPDAPVLVVEGEKAADAAAELFPDHVVVSWSNGSKAIRHVDWQPLTGRTCRLWPDNDKQGREAMASLAGRLVGMGCSVAVADYPADSVPEGWDLADATGWTQQQAADALVKHGRLVEVPQAPAAEPEHVVKQREPVVSVPSTRPFSCLGFDDGGYFYQPGDTGQVIRIGGGSHNATNLLRLADIAYWETCHPGKIGPNWQAAVSRLFRDQAAAGVYSPDRIRGRGAWWDKGRSVLHLGDRLIVDGTRYSVMKPPPSRFSYQRLAAIDLPDTLEPLTDHQGCEILDIASRFLWEVPASGLLIAGWAALAPICGSLAWRPHIWLTASAGSGKSALLNRFLGTLLDSLALWPEGSTSEASIRQELRADALPVIMDEAESNEQADRNRIQNILALARVASSSGRGFVGRGGADGAAQRFVIRSMFLLCSISTALKQGADASRFAQLTLRNPSFLPVQQRQAHWTDLDRDITATITPELGHRMALRSVQLIPVIRDSIAVFRRAAANRFDSQRQGDQYGTLLAGAWSLMNSRVATEQDAMELIDANDWSQYREAAEQSDEERCLARILQHQLRVEGDRGNGYMRTVWELVELVRGTATSMEISNVAAESHLGRIGLRVMDGRLFVANTALGLQRILHDTQWSHSWPTVLSRLPGAEKPGKVRFRGMERNSRAVSLPLDLG